MAVTTSVFPNLNTFSLGPEFCVLYRKLLSTCATYKRVTLAERYPSEGTTGQIGKSSSGGELAPKSLKNGKCVANMQIP